MKKLLTIVAGVAVLATAAHAQYSERRVLEPNARNDQPTVGPPQTVDPKIRSSQAPIPVPDTGPPYGALGGATGSPNPDRVPPGTPGGQAEH